MVSVWLLTPRGGVGSTEQVLGQLAPSGSRPATSGPCRVTFLCGVTVTELDTAGSVHPSVDRGPVQRVQETVGKAGRARRQEGG